MPNRKIWYEQAKCRTSEGRVLFDKTLEHNNRTTEWKQARIRAIQTCATCPVKAECFEEALNLAATRYEYEIRKIAGSQIWAGQELREIYDQAIENGTITRMVGRRMKSA